MKRIALATLVALTTALVAPSPAHAQSGGQRAARSSISVPVTGAGGGATFSGIFELQKFVSRQGGVYAMGLLTGTVTNAAGEATSVVRTVSIPVNVGQAAPTAQSPSIQATCDILHLDLGPLSLDLLGLNIDLSRIILDITAESGAGNLLGNLLCAVTGLLDNPTGLANLLNQILALL